MRTAFLTVAQGRASELLALEARQDELERELATAEEPQPLLHPNLPEVYRQKLAALHKALAVEGSRDNAFELIRSWSMASSGSICMGSWPKF